MKEIRIHPRLQVLTVAALIAAIGAGVAAQLPEIQRYLKVKSM
jgi:hypothetical protein